MSIPETLPSVRELKRLVAGHIAERVPELVRVYPFVPAHLQGLPCVTLLTQRYDPVQAETGPHDDTTYEWRLRLYVQLNDYERAQNELDDLIPLILDVPRHHPTLDGLVDFLVFYDSGGEPDFSPNDGWVHKDLYVRVTRTEL